MATEEINTVIESHPMTGGDGPVSYAKNSSLQRIVVDTTKKLITEVIADKLNIKNPTFESCSKFQIVDLGCSVGPNTFVAVENIIEAVDQKYKTNQHNSLTPEFQVYFNDHVGNDFNTLFRNLPQPCPYFAAAVPGSFYDRLFPKSTIHFVHSSNALHWLTRVPKEVVDKNSPAWNKGRIYCRGTERNVAEAYRARFEKDMDSFLNARAEEIVEGGLMVLLISGTEDGLSHSQTLVGKTYDILGSCLLDMSKKGLVSEEKVDSFNLPLYFPYAKEMETMILRSRYFAMERMEVLTYNNKVQSLNNNNIKMWALHVRAGIEGVIRNHFGDEIVEELFECFHKKLVKNFSTLFEETDNDGTMLFIVLKRNSNLF